MSDDCIFCQILAEKAPCYPVHETRYTKTFLDIFPAAPGHCLIVTKEHFTDIFDAPGADLTYIYCAGCHSERLVAQQGLTREDWDELLVWMVEEQGMPEIEEPDLTAVLDYLRDHYGPARPNFPAPLGAPG